MVDKIRAELPARLKRVRQIVTDRELDGLVVYGDAGHPGNIRYLTNYIPFFGPAVLVLSKDGASRLVVTFDWEVPRAHEASGLEQTDAGHDISALVAGSLRSLGLADGARLGLVGLDVIPHPTYLALADAGRDPVDMSGDFAQLRLIKSPLEQEMLRSAVSATDAAFEALFEQASAGMTELEVAALAEFEMRKAGAQGFSFPSGIASGPNGERPISLPSNRRLETGDLVMVDIGATLEGYCADLTRTFVVGKPTQRQTEIFAAVGDALTAATALARPGVPAADLHRAAVEALAKCGIDQFFTHRAGHGIGLETSLEAIDLRRDEMQLRPGMTFCIEPGVYIPGFGGIKVEDDLVVTQDEPEILSHVTRELVSV